MRASAVAPLPTLGAAALWPYFPLPKLTMVPHFGRITPFQTCGDTITGTHHPGNMRTSAIAPYQLSVLRPFGRISLL
jgi:hypothetical protein